MIYLLEERNRLSEYAYKEPDEKMAKYRSTTLSHVIKIGFELSILEEKNGKKSN